MPRGHATTEEGRQRKLANLIPHQQQAGMPSRNPLGVLTNKNYVEAVRICREAAPELLADLVHRLKTEPDIPFRDRSAATMAIVERGFGKAKDIEDKSPGAMSEDQARVLAEMLADVKKYFQPPIDITPQVDGSDIH